MLSFLKGKLIELKTGKCTIEVGGIGFDAIISFQTYLKLKGKEEIFLWTYLQIKEEAVNLFGFFSEEEKDFFLKLISIPGIGPKMAIQILSHYPLEDLKKAISSQDIKKISSISGVGKKTAERLILELKGMLPLVTEEKEIKNEAISALKNLGYNPKIANQVVEEVLRENPSKSLEEIIINALKLLGK